MTGLAEGAPAPRQRRWWLRAFIALLVIALLAVAAEIALRAIIPNVVAGAVRDSFKLTADHPVEVELGGLMLPYALQGRTGELSVSVDDAPVFEGINVSVTAHAASVPFDVAGGSIEGATAAITIPKDQLGPVISLATGGLADSGLVKGDQFVVGASVPLFGQPVALTASVTLGIENGDAWIEPREVSVAGFDLTAEQLRGLTGSLLDGVLTSHTVCIRDQLPAGVTLTELAYSTTGSIRITAALSPRILADPAALKPGSCAA